MLTQRRIGKKSHHGIEIINNLQWEQWEPGGEYTQKLILKNVNMKAKKLKYRLPNSQFFTTRYPQPITLSSGTSISLPVTFRPLVKDKYEEYIEFITKDGQFKIPMKATLPKPQLKVPESINFGLCAVQDHVAMNFEVNNISDLHVKFLLKSDDTFTLSPSSGTLAPNTHAQITVTFKPQGAYVYEVDALCFFGVEINLTNPLKIKFEGIGKYPHLILKHGKQQGHEILLDFGENPVGGICEKSVDINNIIPVNAPFQVLQKSQGLFIDNPFQCSQYHGVISAGQSTKLQFSFTPELTNIEYVEQFEILSVSLSSKALVKCIGRGIGPQLEFDVTSVNFGSTKSGNAITRSFKLKNVSNMTAVYQFQIDGTNSVFNLNHFSGVIGGKTSKSVVITFLPVKPISYYKRLICLVHNQGPIFIDLFGSCFTNEIKPVVLTRQHIENNRIHESIGVSKFSPEDLLTFHNEKKIVLDETNVLHVIDNELEKKLQKHINLSPFEEYFNDGSFNEEVLNIPHVSLEERCIDFGMCIENSVIQKSVNVTNHTSGKVTCAWMNCNESNFSVQPEEADIDANSSISFRIIFRPTSTSQFYWCELEAYAFYKSMRDHQLVDMKMITPPWCLNLKVSASTFPIQKETFVPSIEWSSTSFTFPPVTPKLEHSYRTCVVKNNSSNNAHFSFKNNEGMDEFTCKPPIALINKDNYQVFVFRMSPMSNKAIKNKVDCVVNYAQKFTQEIELNVTVENPQVVLTPDDFVYFKPTCIKSYSTQTVRIKNITRFPLRLKWKISSPDDLVLNVSPESCMISPNEIQKHKWTFSPVEKCEYLFKVRLFAYIDSSESFFNRYELHLLGVGESGSIRCDKAKVDFGDSIVGERSHNLVTLWNDTDCCLKYKLLLKQKVSTLHSEKELTNEPLVLSLDHDEFLLPSKSSRRLRISVSPKQRALYQCDIFYKLISQSINNVEVSRDIEEDEQHLCHVVVQGVYPSVVINDICGLGCLQHYSKNTLWEFFHVNNFNILVDADPAASELIYGMYSRHSTSRRMPDTTLAVNEFNFGSSVYSSEPSIICINLHNNTQSSTQWICRYPSDIQLELDYWSDTSDLDVEELHELYVTDSKLFEIQPMNGVIQPGHSQVLKCIYRHESIGVHKIPILFKIKNGREIKLNLIGQTLPPDISELFFIRKTHVFDPVCIGCLMPPIQTYRLYNGSNQTVRFAFDLSNIDELQKVNYDWRVLECLTPMGEIPPFQYADTKWLFAPLEVKCYELTIPILVENGEAYDINFSGSGYDSNIMGNTVSVTDVDDQKQSKCISNGPDDLIEISKERISFSHIPLFYEACEMLFIKNVSKDYSVSFQFHLEETPAEGIVSIDPRENVLLPGEVKACKLKLFSEGPAAIHDFDIICEAKNETLMQEFQKQFNVWQAKEDEKKHLFTIRDVFDTPSVQRSLSANTKRLRSIPSGNPNVIDRDIRRYETLPPITGRDRKPERIVIEETPSESQENAPVPPKSVLHHVVVYARTYSIFEYEELLPDSLEKCFIQRSTLKTQPEKAPVSSAEENHLLENVLTMIIKDCLDDRYFIQAIRKLKNEPIPYFSMISTRETAIDEPLDYGLPFDTTDILNVESNIESHSQVLRASISDNMSDNDGTIALLEHDQTNQANKEHSEVKDVDEESTVNPLHVKLFEREELKRNDEFRYVIHDVLENTIFNLLNEAAYGEISLTNRPRLIALPPSSTKQ